MFTLCLVRQPVPRPRACTAAAISFLINSNSKFSNACARDAQQPNLCVPARASWAWPPPLLELSVLEEGMRNSLWKRPCADIETRTRLFNDKMAPWSLQLLHGKNFSDFERRNKLSTRHISMMYCNFGSRTPQSDITLQYLVSGIMSLCDSRATRSLLIG